MQLTINLSGQAEVLKSLRDKLFDTNSRLTEVIQKGAFDIERDAKVLARVDLGRLRASITVEMVSDEEARIGTNVEYAPYVEFGTGRANSNYPAEAIIFKGKKSVAGQKAQPYLLPAFKNNIDRINKNIENAIKSIEK